MKIIIIINIIFFGFLIGQGDLLHTHPKEFNDEKITAKNKRERMENMMIWRLTDQLELKTEQAEVFFPIYRKHMSDLKKINEGQKEIADKIKTDVDSNRSFSKTGVRNILIKYNNLEEKKLDQKKQFIKEVENILDPKQVAILGVFKHKMMKEMRKEIRGYKDDRLKLKKNRKGRKSIWN